MRAVFLAGTLLIAFALPAFAQAPSGQQDQQGNQSTFGNQEEQDNSGPPGPMWRGGGPHGWSGMHNWQGGAGPWSYMGRKKAFGALGAGTFYRFKHGDNEVDVHCPPGVQLRDCIGGAIALMKALPPAGSAPSAGQTQQ